MPTSLRSAEAPLRAGPIRRHGPRRPTPTAPPLSSALSDQKCGRTEWPNVSTSPVWYRSGPDRRTTDASRVHQPLSLDHPRLPRWTTFHILLARPHRVFRAAVIPHGRAIPGPLRRTGHRRSGIADASADRHTQRGNRKQRSDRFHPNRFRHVILAFATRSRPLRRLRPAPAFRDVST
jgi:hypothetical protein